MQSLTLNFLKIFSSVSKHFKVIVENPTNTEKAAGGLSMSRDPLSPLWSSYPGTHGWGCRRPPLSPSHSAVSGHCSVRERHPSCTARALPGHLGQRHKLCRQPPPQRMTDNWLCPCNSVASAGGRRPLEQALHHSNCACRDSRSMASPGATAHRALSPRREANDAKDSVGPLGVPTEPGPPGD